MTISSAAEILNSLKLPKIAWPSKIVMPDWTHMEWKLTEEEVAQKEKAPFYSRYFYVKKNTSPHTLTGADPATVLSRVLLNAHFQAIWSTFWSSESKF